MFLKYIGILLFILISGSILYFSWVPNSNLSSLNWLPWWLTSWTDKEENSNIRTSVPMFLWGFFACYIFRIEKNSFKKIIGFSLLGFALLLLAEGVQRFLPNRIADWGDVFWGCVGLFSGILSFILLKWLLGVFQK
jgi:VanZ family protein